MKCKYDTTWCIRKMTSHSAARYSVLHTEACELRILLYLVFLIHNTTVAESPSHAGAAIFYIKRVVDWTVV